MQLRSRADSGEAFRAGLNWRSPDDWGCRVKHPGGALSMQVDPATATGRSRLTILLRLAGSERQRCRYNVIGGVEVASGILGQREKLTVRVEVQVPLSGIVTLIIAGDTEGADDAGTTPGSRHASETVGVECFLVQG